MIHLAFAIALGMLFFLILLSVIRGLFMGFIGWLEWRDLPAVKARREARGERNLKIFLVVSVYATYCWIISYLLLPPEYRVAIAVAPPAIWAIRGIIRATKGLSLIEAMIFYSVVFGGTGFIAGIAYLAP